MATAASIGAGATCSADLGDESETQATLRASVICGDIEAVADALRSGADAALQDDSDGSSPLILAAKGGHVDVVQLLLQHGAPWNAVDRQQKCAGTHAFEAGHQAVVDVLVDAGVRAEMLFRTLEQKKNAPETEASTNNKKYLDRGVSYKGDTLLDADGRGVMMEWERKLMAAHAEIICQTQGDVLNVGFGMGIVDEYIQMADGWDKRPGVRVLFGRWEDIVRDTPDLGTFDGIFFDTFDDDFLAFHDVVPALLSPGGVYSFFNGIYPENVFFQGVACQMIQNHLETFGLETKFIECDVDCGDDKTWEGVQFRYFQGGRYFLPMIYWRDQPDEEPDDNTTPTPAAVE